MSLPVTEQYIIIHGKFFILLELQKKDTHIKHICKMFTSEMYYVLIGF